MKFKWITVGTSLDDTQEFLIVPESFDSKELLLNPEGPFDDILAQAKDGEWAKRITDALNAVPM